MNTATAPQNFPGGYFVGFTGGIDRKAAEQIVVQVKGAYSIGHSRVNLLMNCHGGSVEEAFYAANILRALSGLTLVTYNLGAVSSSGNLIFLCGEERYFADGATIYFHLTHGGMAAPLNNALLRYQTRNFQLGDDRISKFVADRTGKPLAEVKRWHTKETIMSTSEALSNGVIQGVQVPSIPRDAHFHQIVF
jgi:ATP-dependent protease ClpP protease subunit